MLDVYNPKFLVEADQVEPHWELGNECMTPDGKIIPGGKYRSHDLFMLGDANKRIYFADGDIVYKDTDGSPLLNEFGEEIHDNWACYLAEHRQYCDSYGVHDEWKHYRLRDRCYFERLLFLASYPDHRYTKQKIWNTVLEIMHLSCMNDCKVSKSALWQIGYIVKTQYAKDPGALEVFVVIYYGMIAENNKMGTKLGSAIKAEGIYELLFEDKAIEEACDCHRGVNATQIRSRCESHGIFHPFFGDPRKWPNHGII